MQSIASQKFPYLSLCVLMLGLSGCASMNSAPQETTTSISTELRLTPDGNLLAELGDAAPGVEIQLSDGSRATADEIYFAASGRTCRGVRLISTNGRSSKRLACEAAGGWQWVPMVTLQSDR